VGSLRVCGEVGGKGGDEKRLDGGGVHKRRGQPG
jgi:hypothetical protein